MEEMKRQFYKGDTITIWNKGVQTNQTTNLDRGRMLGKGDVFDWRINNKMKPTRMMVLSNRFPLEVEIID